MCKSEMIVARMDEKYWVRCGRCSHKLMRVVGGGESPAPTVEIKCHSCKSLNLWMYDGSHIARGVEE